MYDIEGWTNNSGSGNLGYEEAFNYVPGVYTGGDSNRELTQSWGGNEAVGTGGSSWNPIQYSGTAATTGANLGGTTYTTSGGSNRSGLSGSLSPSYQYIAPYLLGSTSTTSYSGGKALPTMTAPEFNLPEYDYGRINYLAQQQAAPLYTKARNAL